MAQGKSPGVPEEMFRFREFPTHTYDQECDSYSRKNLLSTANERRENTRDLSNEFGISFEAIQLPIVVTAPKQESQS